MTPNGFVAPLHADGVNGARYGRMPLHDRVRQDILAHAGPRPHHGMFSDAHTMVYGAASRQNGVIPPRNMAGGSSEPGENHMVADLAIMPGMAGNQEKVVICLLYTSRCV